MYTATARLFALMGMFFLALPVAASAAGDFVAQSPNPMSWSDAKKFCESKDGKLPLVNNVEVLEDVTKGLPVDGFGAIGDKWSAGVDGDKYYWLGTTPTPAPHKRAYSVGTRRGITSVSESMSGGQNLVVCVPK